MLSMRHVAPPMRMKSSGSSGNSAGNASGTVTFQMNGGSALRPRNSPMVATTTAKGLRFEIGRMMSFSMSTPTTKAVAAATNTASQGDRPRSLYHQARKALIIAISPWAKFRWPLPR